MKKKYLLFLAAVLAWSSPALAHDEGHGPQLTDTGNYGGVITAVVESKNASQGKKAPLVYKAELSRSEDGTVRVYIYDQAMKPLPAGTLENNAKANVISPKGGSFKTEPFSLNLEGQAYTGKAPQASGKPFSIDVTFKTKTQELLAAFDNLD
ncbi:MAG TPA: hypothetical protein VJP40_03550 [bacterium]|nr:hypothetical protein [bacterium]